MFDDESVVMIDVLGCWVCFFGSMCWCDFDVFGLFGWEWVMWVGGYF